MPFLKVLIKYLSFIISFKFSNGQYSHHILSLMISISNCDRNILISPNLSRIISNSSSVNYQYLHTVVKDNLAKLAVIVSLETKDVSDTVKNFGKQLSCI